jgi:hypothetical protein
MAILGPGSDPTLMPRLEDMKRNQSLEGATRLADLVLIGKALPKVVACTAFGRPARCQEVSVQRVLKGRLEPEVIGIFTKGFRTSPEPVVPAIYFLRRLDAMTFEVLQFSAGARAIRGDRLRESGVSLDEAVARIRAVAAQ